MGDERRLVEAAYQHPLNRSLHRSPQNSAATRLGIHAFWKELGRTVAHSLSVGHGTLLPRLGVISLLRPPPDTTWQRSPVFVVDKVFAAENCMQGMLQGQGTKQPRREPLQHTPHSWSAWGSSPVAIEQPHPLNFIAIGISCGMSKDHARHIWNVLTRCIGDFCREPAGALLKLDPVGALLCDKGLLEFHFDMKFCRTAGINTPQKGPRRALPIVDPFPSPEELTESEQGHQRRVSEVVTPPSSLSSSMEDDSDDDDSRCSIPDSGPSHALCSALPPSNYGAVTVANGEPFAGCSKPISTEGSWLKLEKRLAPTSLQTAKLNRMCRILDAFALLDRQDKGHIKAHDLTIGFNKHFQLKTHKDEACSVVSFLSKTRPDEISRAEFVRAFIHWERVCLVDQDQQKVEDKIAAVPLFSDTDEKTRLQLANKMHRTVLPAETVVVRKGETGGEMFFIVRTVCVSP